MIDLFTPGAPWAKGPSETGYEAAESVAGDVVRLRGLTVRCVGAAGRDGLTSEELAEVAQVTFAAIQPRTSELRAIGAIVDSGQRRHNRSGRRAIVWTLPQYAAKREGGAA